MTKTKILIKRGFTRESIAAGLSDIKNEDWDITTITREDVIAADPQDDAAIEILQQRLFAKDSVSYRMSSTATNYPFSYFADTDIDARRSPPASQLSPPARPPPPLRPL